MIGILIRIEVKLHKIYGANYDYGCVLTDCCRSESCPTVNDVSVAANHSNITSVSKQHEVRFPSRYLYIFPIIPLFNVYNYSIDTIIGCEINGIGDGGEVSGSIRRYCDDLTRVILLAGALQHSPRLSRHPPREPEEPPLVSRAAAPRF